MFFGLIETETDQIRELEKKIELQEKTQELQDENTKLKMKLELSQEQGKAETAAHKSQWEVACCEWKQKQLDEWNNTAWERTEKMLRSYGEVVEKLAEHEPPDVKLVCPNCFYPHDQQKKDDE